MAWEQHEVPGGEQAAARLLDLLAGWAPGDATRRRMLVDNLAGLFGF